METIKTNILVVGSGMAGAIAAITAAEENKKVILITNSDTLLSGNTRWAQGGIAYFNQKDSVKTFTEDIYSAGGNHNYKPAVQQLVKCGPKLIEKLLFQKFKIPFEKDKNNQLIFTSEAAHSINRIIHCKDATGLTIHTQIAAKLKVHPNITIYTNHTAIDLLTYSHHSSSSIDIYNKPACFGAVVLNEKNQQII